MVQFHVDYDNILYNLLKFRHDNSKLVLAYSVIISIIRGACMKQLNICTRNHSNLLKEFARDTHKLHNRNGLTSINYRINIADDFIVDGLLALLINTALQENPIFKHSPKLRDMAGDLRDTQVYVNLKRGLIRFLRANNSLHLDGYVAFRMTEYREKLDMMSYSLIKKMKLIHQD